MKKWYQLASDDESADLFLYGDICEFEWFDSDKSSYSMAKDIQALEGKPLNVHINSYGG